MSRKDSIFKKASSSKAFYIAAAAAFCAIIVSVVLAYYSSDRLGQQPSRAQDVQTSWYDAPAEVNKTDVSDERETDEPETDTTANRAETTRPVESETTTAPAAQAQAQAQTQAANSSYVFPCDGEVVKRYSASEPVYSETMQDWRVHMGIDIALQEGGEIRSIGNGSVTKVASDTKWGYIIEVNYGDLTARYCGIDQDGAVSINAHVKQGDIIGKAVSIPIEAQDGVHLHLEVFNKDGRTVDPLELPGMAA